MNSSLQLLSSTSLTMSSLEIAELTGKRHDNVLADIRKILAEVGIDSTVFLGVYKDQQLIGRPCFNLPRRECDLVIAGYSSRYRLAIIDRWQELEIQKSKLPSNYIEALQYLIESEKAKEDALLIVKKQNITLQAKDDLIRVSNEASIKAGEILIREFVKAVDIIDLGEKRFYQWMREQRIVSDKNEPYSNFVKVGYFTYKPSEELYGGKFRYTLRVTPRGKVWLAAKYMAYVDSLEFTALGNGEMA